jgi:hypothetical protein
VEEDLSAQVVVLEMVAELFVGSTLEEALLVEMLSLVT